MDPRPYHFEFRKPRFSNPTFQSANLYNSIYQLPNDNYAKLKNPQSFRYKKSQNQKTSSEPDTAKRNMSMELPKANKVQINRYQSKIDMQSVQKDAKISLPSNQKNGSKLSSYGYNLMKANQPQQSFINDQRQIFDKQQHAFDIINYHPNPHRARLKMFPKFTLEDKVYQRRGSPIKKLQQ